MLDAARDLYVTLSAKERRDRRRPPEHLDPDSVPSSSRWESRKSRSRGRARSLADEDNGFADAKGDCAIQRDKALVWREFEGGIQAAGERFAIGDGASVQGVEAGQLQKLIRTVLSQLALQAETIVVQEMVVSIFLYGPSSLRPITDQLATILAASRTASAAVVRILVALNLRLQTVDAPARPPPSPHYPLALPAPPLAAPGALVFRPGSSSPRAQYASLPRPRAQRTDTESTSFFGLTPPQPLPLAWTPAPGSEFCSYALSLQLNSRLPLAASLVSQPTPTCPLCARTLHFSPRRTWELDKETRISSGTRIRSSSDTLMRTFRLRHRFLVKCHRPGEDGGYSCVLCARGTGAVETVCGDVKALVRHVWEDHDADELLADRDIEEVRDEEDWEDWREEQRIPSHGRAKERSRSSGWDPRQRPRHGTR